MYIILVYLSSLHITTGTQLLYTNLPTLASRTGESIAPSAIINSNWQFSWSISLSLLKCIYDREARCLLSNICERLYIDGLMEYRWICGGRILVYIELYSKWFIFIHTFLYTSEHST